MARTRLQRLLARLAAHGALRRLGQTICRNSRPACAGCALRGDCPSAVSS